MNFSQIKVSAPPDGWNMFNEPRPYVAVSGFAIESSGKFPVLYRSDKVRSAKNCWSLPSGLHEVGLTKGQQFCNELHEELNIIPHVNTVVEIGSYENISFKDKWHWSIHMLAVKVESLALIINKEPDKHSEIRLITVDELLDIAPWAPNLDKFITENIEKIKTAIQNLK